MAGNVSHGRKSSRYLWNTLNVLSSCLHAFVIDIYFSSSGKIRGKRLIEIQEKRKEERPENVTSDQRADAEI